MSKGLNILITNNTLAGHAGTEIYTRDLAIELQRRGHGPVVYSTVLGPVADEIRRETIPVVDNLHDIGRAPDLIHGNSSIDLMSALLHFPNTPAVFFCHGWVGWIAAPPKFPRIYRNVAVDHTCLDRLRLEHGIAEEKTKVILNFVDLKRFKARTKPLPEKPARALIFSNYATEESTIRPAREACGRLGITLDVVGEGYGRPCGNPEKILPDYDLVFAKAKAAMEAIACGAAVILCDVSGLGPMVTSAEFDQLQAFNFGVRTLRNPLEADAIVREICRYGAHDAGVVSQMLRSTANFDKAVDQILAVYDEVINEHGTAVRLTLEEEMRYVAGYIREFTSQQQQADKLYRGYEVRGAEIEQMRRELSQLKNSATMKVKNSLISHPMVKMFIGLR